jgi:hypothetical protein
VQAERVNLDLKAPPGLKARKEKPEPQVPMAHQGS